MKKKRQRLVAVQVATAPGDAGLPAIVPVEGGTLEELAAEEGQGRLGFGAS